MVPRRSARLVTGVDPNIEERLVPVFINELDLIRGETRWGFVDTHDPKENPNPRRPYSAVSHAVLACIVARPDR